MVKEEVRIDIYGEQFYPKVIEDLFNIKFGSSITPGEVGKKGRYKGEAIPYGSASFSSDPDVSNQILWMLNFIKDKIKIIRLNGGDSIKLKVVYSYKGQCNCELGVEEISLLADFKIPFLFSVYEDENIEDE